MYEVEMVKSKDRRSLVFSENKSTWDKNCTRTTVTRIA
jgi:hypothetical protein